MTQAPMPQGRWRAVIQLVLLALLAWQMLGLASSAASRNLLFDGGMNMAVSKSIAEGLGPRARYDAGELYPVAVQSKEPFFLVGAAVFKVFGVGPVQAQVPNLLYLLALTVLIVCVVARASDLETGLLAAVIVLSMPQLHQYGLNGFGEIATMCFGLAAISIVAWPRRLSSGTSSAGALARPFLAGVFGALAVATKVVGIVQLAAIALVLAWRVWVDADQADRPRALLRAGLAFAAGMAMPLALIEAWRWHWMGGRGYRDYWAFQLESIRGQSGAAGSGGHEGALSRIPAHFAALTREISRGTLATLSMLFAPLLAIAATSWARRRTGIPSGNGSRHWLIVALVFVACAYIPWWFAIVPTNKAWVRYLYIALLALALLSAMATMAAARIALFAKSFGLARRIAFAAIAIGLAVLYAPLVGRSVQKLDFSPSEEVQAVQYAARAISKLPPDRLAFGYGWYSAPVIQLYSDRAFKDLSDWPIGRLTNEEGYLVSDRAQFQVHLIDRVLKRYPHRLLMRDNPFAQVYALDFAHPYDPFVGADATKIATRVRFGQADYPLVEGYEPFDPTGGRYVESDSEILLRYEGQAALVLDGYAALPGYYLYPDQPLRGRVVVDGCPPQAIAWEGAGWKSFRIPLVCRPATGAPVRVRLLFDNVFDLPLVYDRQRAVLVREIGFAD